MKKTETILLIFVTIFSIIMCLSVRDGYNNCNFYLGYNQKNEQYPIVYWAVNQQEYGYINYVDISEQYHTSCYFLDGSAGKIKNMSFTLDGRGEQYEIDILTIVCDNSSINYYPNDIMKNFAVQGAEKVFINEAGKLVIQTGSQDCVLTPAKEICSQINKLRTP